MTTYIPYELGHNILGNSRAIFYFICKHCVFTLFACKYASKSDKLGFYHSDAADQIHRPFTEL